VQSIIKDYKILQKWARGGPLLFIGGIEWFYDGRNTIISVARLDNTNLLWYDTNKEQGKKLIFPKALVGKFDHDAMLYLRLRFSPKLLSQLLGVSERLIKKSDRDINVPYSIGQFAAALWLCGLFQYRFSEEIFKNRNILPKIEKAIYRLVNAKVPANNIYKLIFDLNRPLNSEEELKKYCAELAKKGTASGAEEWKSAKIQATTR